MSTLLMWIGLITVDLLFISFVEYAIHRFIMHKLVPGFEETWKQHQKQHHGNFYHVFDFESDPIGKYLDLKIGWKYTLLFILIFVPGIFLISVENGCLFTFLIVLHNRTWDAIHSEMHLNRGRFFSQWSIYRFLYTWHKNHHKHNKQCYNVVLPFWDFVFGTY